ncbi:TPA: lpg1666 family Dot/Icm T4SS effector [Legionella pneumophila]|nr:lpg1666 family Dot/Icm T4SS effector [Legionella pneumophila]HAT1807281.1 lpg1666 family Dot/Icm T4SS effector [Legionella pneumophila]HAU1407904.1 lpg1666 family Dot/Icm T4SS effector [Legionella pneumophila]
MLKFVIYLSSRVQLMGKKAYIIGMGPAGLASALALLAKGYSVELIDRRSEDDVFSRKQGVFLKDDTIRDFFALSQLASKGYSLEFKDNFICKLIRPIDESNLQLSAEDQLDLAFFELIEKERTVIPIAELQRYQYSKLKYIYDKGGFTFQDEEDPYTVKFNNAEQQLIFHLGDTQIAKVDAENQKLTLDHNGSIQNHSFDLLVDASGKTSKSFTQLWNSQNPEFAIGYEKLDNPDHNAFGVMYLSINNPPLAMIANPVLSPTEGTSFIPLDKITPLKAMGWTHDYPPLIYLKYSKKNGAVYLTGEIPESILKDNNKKELKQWFDLVLQLLFNNTDFKMSAPGLASVFKTDIEIADKFALLLPKGGVFCLVGDALMSANFLLGCGISNALDDANKLPDMVDNQFSQSEAEAYRNLRYLDYKDDWLFFKEHIALRLKSLQLEKQLDLSRQELELKQRELESIQQQCSFY